MFKRRKSKKVKVGSLYIGGNSPITVQSMSKTDTRDISSTVKQIKLLEKAGCEIIRVAVLNQEAACCLGEIKKKIKIPLVADIHFDYRLALESIKQGVDKVRINPGNIGDRDRIRQVVKAAKEKKIPIRIGVNSGSIERRLLEKFGFTSCAMVESALSEISLFEKEKFYDIVVSLKGSDVPMTVEAYQMLSGKCEYPLHLGITAAGPFYPGMIKSSVGVGSLLLQGIGDTIRVSLTARPEEEVLLGQKILESVGLRKTGPEIISCPTCGRCEVDMIKLTEKVEKALKGINKPIKVAVMGCAVNGPGEAREADIGVASGKGCGLLFKKGKIIRKIQEKDLFPELIKEIRKIRKFGTAKGKVIIHDDFDKPLPDDIIKYFA
ncbi:MAG: flavodoxin-dependent (E)-4-hydroxy-3-methylbut-2-enyl-diphosphate synthase [bacterium]